ncbi:MAG: DUF3473 domain-containing protein [Planctomycetes bacterium]|nr:DUF3473 domain-containing protein [Planctomycetota bacterium]
MLNAFTVDVEEWFHVCRAERYLPRDRWESLPSRVERGVDAIRTLCDRYSFRATFFVLGWVAERHPAMIRSLAADGHEIACHGHDHTVLFDQRPSSFREDLARATSLLTGIAGSPPQGYRAPEWSVTRETAWALDEIARAGYLYDASHLPSRICGRPGLRRWPHLISTDAGTIAEFPATTLSLLRQRLPCLSGFSLRCFPLSVLRRHIEKVRGAERPVSVAVHPWEFDPDPPRAPLPWGRGFAHYFRIRSTPPKVEALCSAFRFAPMRDVLAALFPPLRDRLRRNAPTSGRYAPADDTPLAGRPS